MESVVPVLLSHMLYFIIKLTDIQSIKATVSHAAMATIQLHSLLSVSICPIILTTTTLIELCYIFVLVLTPENTSCTSGIQ